MIFHDFTNTILSQIKGNLKLDGRDVLQVSPLLEYINIKTKSANRGSKARGSFANLYAIYVLVEDYIKVVFENKKEYKKYAPICLQGNGNCHSERNCKITH